MSTQAVKSLDQVRPQPVKAQLEDRQAPPSGGMVEAAMKRARMEPKQLADEMGVSHSFLLRGFKDQEHISWQRLHRVRNRKFRHALLAVQAEENSGVVVTLHIAIPHDKVG